MTSEGWNKPHIRWTTKHWDDRCWLRMTHTITNVFYCTRCHAIYCVACLSNIYHSWRATLQFVIYSALSAPLNFHDMSFTPLHYPCHRVANSDRFLACPCFTPLIRTLKDDNWCLINLINTKLNISMAKKSDPNPRKWSMINSAMLSAINWLFTTR